MLWSSVHRRTCLCIHHHSLPGIEPCSTRTMMIVSRLKHTSISCNSDLRLQFGIWWVSAEPAVPTSFPQVDGIIVQRFRPFRWTSSTVFHSFFFLPFRGISDFGSDGSGGDRGGCRSPNFCGNFTVFLWQSGRATGEIWGLRPLVGSQVKPLRPERGLRLLIVEAIFELFSLVIHARWT